jgi:cytoskeletal protein CcmA (bactofilin family)
MDPSALQSDKDNDVHSLEGTSTVVEPNGAAGSNAPATDDTTPIEAPAPAAAPTPSNKPSLLKRLWGKLNIYILLFILLVLVAGGVLVGLYLKSRNDNKLPDSTIGAQNLSPDALKQLANSDVTIGSSNQILNVASNAVFSGSVLVRNSLEVAGALKVGGDLSLPGITVSGASKFGQVQADTLAVTGPANVQGVLTAKHGLSVTGTGTFTGAVTAAQISTGALTLNGDLTLTRHITAGGPIPRLSNGSALGSGGTASVSGSDTTGSITINTGSGAGAGCFATLTFTQAFSNTPHVQVTPIGNGAAALSYYVNRSTSSMSVCTVSPPPSGQTFGFDYMVLN